MAAERPVVVALGPVDPALVAGVLGDGVSFVAEPDAADLAVAVGAIARADAVVDAELFDRAPRLRVVARTAAAPGPSPKVSSPWPCTSSSGWVP